MTSRLPSRPVARPHPPVPVLLACVLSAEVTATNGYRETRTVLPLYKTLD